MSAKLTGMTIVHQSPQIEKPPGILNRPDGSVLLECIIQGVPEPTVKWFRGDDELVADDKHTFKQKKMCGKYNCTLNIKNPDKTDQGVYTIVATNDYGSHRQQQNYVVSCVADSVYRT